MHRPTVKRGMDCGMESFRGKIRRGVVSFKGRDHGCGLLRTPQMGVAFNFGVHRSLFSLGAYAQRGIQ